MHVGRTADIVMCVTYFEVGRLIVEEEQSGKARAEYGRGLLTRLSEYLTTRFQKGFSETNLRNARKFYQVYAPSIQQTASAELGNELQFQVQQTISAEFKGLQLTQKQQSMISEIYPFRLSWSHYLILMRIQNTDERRFYEIEAEKQQWTYKQLQRQYGSSLYERLALSRDKDEVMKLAKEGQTIDKPRDILKNPLVLEFLEMEERAQYSESDLETAIIDKLQTFLLELGKGFLFEARQKRFTFNEQHFMVVTMVQSRDNLAHWCYALLDRSYVRQALGFLNHLFKCWGVCLCQR
ncbi:MAG: PDDEXK nuclease domain-containing protein [Peptococcaceae bacterium]|nr:PDDEXK nuclease domain-containing protein [Peptococcaceae bacterium]